MRIAILWPVSCIVPLNSATADKSEQESFDFAPYFALNGGASDFAKATPDKSRGRPFDGAQGRQDRLRGNDRGRCPFGKIRTGVPTIGNERKPTQ